MKAQECSQHFSHYTDYMDFSRSSRAANSAVHGKIWPNSEFVRDFINVLITCNNQEDPIKIKAL